MHYMSALPPRLASRFPPPQENGNPFSPDEGDAQLRGRPHCRGVQLHAEPRPHRLNVQRKLVVSLNSTADGFLGALTGLVPQITPDKSTNYTTLYTRSIYPFSEKKEKKIRGAMVIRTRYGLKPMHPPVFVHHILVLIIVYVPP